jgi:hypothetical protein
VARVARGEADEVRRGEPTRDDGAGCAGDACDDVGEERLVEPGRVSDGGSIGPTEAEEIECDDEIVLRQRRDSMAPLER